MTQSYYGKPDPFTEACQRNLPALSITPVNLPDPASILNHFPPHLHHVLGKFENKSGYYNPVGGWVEAARAVEVAMKKVRQLGCVIEGGKTVKELLIEDGKCRGVILESGERMGGYDLVVVAMGSW